MISNGHLNDLIVDACKAYINPKNKSIEMHIEGELLAYLTVLNCKEITRLFLTDKQKFIKKIGSANIEEMKEKYKKC